jgi:hypothetical protein
MENDDTKNGDEETPEKLSPSTAKVNTDKKTNKTKAGEDKTRQPRKYKKWTLWQHWKRAGQKTRMKWIAELFGILVGLGLFLNSCWGNLQSIWNFKAEHRPKVVVSRPPELLGIFECAVTDRAIWLHAGAMHVWVKNIKRGDALGAFIGGPMLKLVADKKTGDAFYDNPLQITDETCKLDISPKKQFPVHGGEEVREDIVQGASVVPLIKTNSTTITFGGPQNEPEPPPGERPSERVPIAKDALFQLYAPVCVYYFDENGVRYGTCRSYRFITKGQSGPEDRSFSCAESPLRGTFEETLASYCEN